jgi:hypothetical protein
MVLMVVTMVLLFGNVRVIEMVFAEPVWRRLYWDLMSNARHGITCYEMMSLN